MVKPVYLLSSDRTLPVPSKLVLLTLPPLPAPHTGATLVFMLAFLPPLKHLPWLPTATNM